jgi:serine/threonine protein kinase
LQLGRYQLGELLGAGGMAEVFKAHHATPRGLQRTVVIKRILPHLSRDPKFVQMFVSEAQILGLLHHPNVIRAYDFGESEGTLFMVLEYVDGPSLHDALVTLRAQAQRMPLLAAAHFALEVARALAHVHNLAGGDGESLNVIHRDVTPSNIILTNDGGIKLLDFGVAKYRDSQVQTVAGTIKGKPAYLAPESLEGKAIDSRVDIFSLGAVLHEMLTLTSLFESDSLVLTFRKILELPIEPPSAIRPSVPPELDAIVMKALARDPGQRYQTAGEMADDLARFVKGDGLRKDRIATFVRDIGAQMASARSSTTTGESSRPPSPTR